MVQSLILDCWGKMGEEEDMPYMFIKKSHVRPLRVILLKKHTAAIFKDVIHYKVCAKCCQKMAIKIHTSKTFCLVLEAFQVFST